MTTPRRPADRISALAGCVDVSGFTPYFSPLMFFVDKSPWPAMTLIMSLAVILLMVFFMVGWRAGMHDRSVIRSNDSYCRSIHVEPVASNSYSDE
jgi:hypothetical protein